MVRINLLPDWRKMARQMAMAKELYHYSLIFLGMTAIFCAFMVVSTMRW